MKPVECEFESDVLAGVLESRWPEGFETNLREHVSTCAICSDVVAVASAIQCDREGLRTRAIIPDSGRVWWLAQVRARREAVQAAARPITIAHMIAFGCAAGALGACFGATSAWFQYELRSIRVSLNSLDVQAIVPSATGLISGHAALAIGMGAVLLIVPAAVYLAIVRD